MQSATELLGACRLTAFSSPVYRNIVSLVVSEDLFDDLTDNPEDYATAQAIESLHTPPHYSSRTPVIDRPFEEAEWFSAIQFPFEHWQESRFSTGKFGVWYGAGDLQTTVYETAYHWLSRTLLEEGQLPAGRQIQRKVYTVHAEALLLDLRSQTRACPALVSPNDYTLTRQIGQIIHRQGHPGLLTRSARCTGEVQAIFNPTVLSNARINCWLAYQIEETCVRVSDSGQDPMMNIPLSQFALQTG